MKEHQKPTNIQHIFYTNEINAKLKARTTAKISFYFFVCDTTFEDNQGIIQI